MGVDNVSTTTTRVIERVELSLGGGLGGIRGGVETILAFGVVENEGEAGKLRIGKGGRILGRL